MDLSYDNVKYPVLIASMTIIRKVLMHPVVYLINNFSWNYINLAILKHFKTIHAFFSFFWSHTLKNIKGFVPWSEKTWMLVQETGLFSCFLHNMTGHHQSRWDFGGPQPLFFFSFFLGCQKTWVISLSRYFIYSCWNMLKSCFTNLMGWTLFQKYLYFLYFVVCITPLVCVHLYLNTVTTIELETPSAHVANVTFR